MFSKLKIIVLLLICFFSVSIFAQEEQYLNTEKNRISMANSIEKEIQKFISKNFNNYNLPQEEINEIREHGNEEGGFSQTEFEKALFNAKHNELRKLFFKNYPEKQEYFIANEIPNSLKQLCVNGDFESGTAGYTFWTDSNPGGGGTVFPYFQSCATPTVLTATNVMTPVVNDFVNARVTHVDNTSPGFLPFDPSLAAFGINVPTLNSNSGNKCIKLNNEQDISSDLTTMSYSFASINQANLDFNFSIIMNNKINHGQPIQPYFRARLYDQSNNIVDEFCIVADPNNCLFNVYAVPNSPEDNQRRMLYTGWICGRLNGSSILNQPGRVEFSISDCAPRAHFGTVYIDNICGITCSTLDLGAVELIPTNIECLNTVSNDPFEICGTYVTPVNATLNTLTLSITQNNVVLTTLTVPSQLTSSAFCFTVTPSMFGLNASGDFEFDVNATFNVNCPAGTFNYSISDHSANTGPDVTFIDCCQPTLTLTSPTDDHNNLSPAAICQRERSDWIKASNVISFGNNALSNGIVYHATNFVELNPGFEAVYSSQFAAYPEGCSGNYLYKNQSVAIQDTPNLDTDIGLVKVDKTFEIMPNPSSNSIEILMKNAKFNKVSITTVDGKMVFETNLESNDKLKVDVSNYANGIYVVTVITDDGQQLTKKLIKN